MKNKKYLYFCFIFVTIFLFGLITFLIPFKYEKFNFTNVTWDNYPYISSKNIKINFDLNNYSTNNYNNISIKVSYSLLNSNHLIQNSYLFENESLNKGSNTFSFILENSSYDIIFKNITSVELDISNQSFFKIYENSTLSTQNLFFISMMIIGIIGSFVCLILYMASNKFYIKSNEINETIENKIKNEFQPIIFQTHSNNNLNKDTKIFCKYCNAQYNKNEDKCPHCGAPPES